MTPEGVVVGSCNKNPNLNYTEHHVESSGGQVKKRADNVIAEIMLMRVGSESFPLTLIDSILDWKKDQTYVAIVDKHFVTSNG